MDQWTFDSKYSFSDKNFSRIYSFFVIETPVENVSKRGITFGQRKIDMKKLNNKIKKISNDLNKKWILLNKGKNIFDELNRLNNLDGLDLSKEFAIHSNNKKTKTKSFFYTIRCAFAHGAFGICKHKKDKYYLLENVHNNKLKGRILIKEKTLLEIIEYCENIGKNTN